MPTRVLDEDIHPVGVFSSLSNRSSVESLLHSQLACIGEEPFDVWAAALVELLQRWV